jgi:hypothetical protein
MIVRSPQQADVVVSCIEDPETQYGLVAQEGPVLVGMIAGYLTDYFFCDEKIACDILLFIDPMVLLQVLARGGALPPPVARTEAAWGRVQIPIGRGVAGRMCNSG